jgi:16S rRNA (uracil1498-N3)-methyltransferase
VDETVRITGEDSRHISKVLRLREGDTIELCDGLGRDYEGVIRRINRNSVEVVIRRSYPSMGEPQTKVILYQAIPKGTKMDIIIQKCVEIGVHRIVPVITARTIVKLDSEEEGTKKVARWQRIAREAAKQSRRGIVPQISMPLFFEDAVQSCANMFCIFPWENERALGIRECLETGKDRRCIAVMIGPEGGWEEDEVMQAKKYGWNTVSLGPRILRTETVGMALLAAIMFYNGEMEHPIG